MTHLPLKITKLFLVFSTLFFMSSCNLVGTQKAGELNDKGLQAMDNGELELAIDYFSEALDQRIIDKSVKATCLRNLAIAWEEFGNADSSRYYSLAAAEMIGKDTYEYDVYMADVSMIDGDIPAAIRRLENAKVKDGENMEVCNLLGLIYLGEYGTDYIDYEQAAYYNRKAYEQGESRATSYLLALSEYYLDNNDVALEIFKEMQMKYPSFIDAQYFEGVIYLENGEFEKGVSVLEDLKTKDASYVEIVDQNIAEFDPENFQEDDLSLEMEVEE